MLWYHKNHTRLLWIAWAAVQRALITLLSITMPRVGLLSSLTLLHPSTQPYHAQGRHGMITLAYLTLPHHSAQHLTMPRGRYSTHMVLPGIRCLSAQPDLAQGGWVWYEYPTQPHMASSLCSISYCPTSLLYLTLPGADMCMPRVGMHMLPNLTLPYHPPQPYHGLGGYDALSNLSLTMA